MPEPFYSFLLRLCLVCAFDMFCNSQNKWHNNIEIYRRDVKKEKAKCEVKAHFFPSGDSSQISTLFKLEILYKLWEDLLPYLLHQFLPKWSVGS